MSKKNELLSQVVALLLEEPVIRKRAIGKLEKIISDLFSSLEDYDLCEKIHDTFEKVIDQQLEKLALEEIEKHGEELLRKEVQRRVAQAIGKGKNK